jgi:hypothetical protein
MTGFSLLVLALVQNQPATTPAASAPPAAEKKVCKTIKETGSRLGGKRECRTTEEWNRIEAENQAKARGNMGR